MITKIEILALIGEVKLLDALVFGKVANYLLDLKVRLERLLIDANAQSVVGARFVGAILKMGGCVGTRRPTFKGHVTPSSLFIQYG